MSASAPGGQARIAYSLSADQPVYVYIIDPLTQEIVWHRKYAAGAMGAKSGYNEILLDGYTDAGTRFRNGAFLLQTVTVQDGKKVPMGTVPFIIID
jgi:hypothetical protein